MKVSALSPLARSCQSRPIYRSTKSYGHNEGLSCCFRQWRAEGSHCKLVHGYALAFRFVFSTYELDNRNWCFDFGDMKEIRSWLHSIFDHTMLVAEDDPCLATFHKLASDGLIDIRVIPAVGCEGTAKYVFDHVSNYIAHRTDRRVWLESVEVAEHFGNSAIYQHELESDVTAMTRCETAS